MPSFNGKIGQIVLEVLEMKIKHIIFRLLWFHFFIELFHVVTSLRDGYAWPLIKKINSRLYKKGGFVPSSVEISRVYDF